MGAHEGGSLREAINYWLRAVQTMASDDPEAMALRTGIVQVQAQINKLDQQTTVQWAAGRVVHEGVNTSTTNTNS